MESLNTATKRPGSSGDRYPFYTNRGGRFVDITSTEEISELALLDSLEETWLNRVSPRKPRRHGSLGFQPGSWWVNTLFACHAGIIDTNTIDGGICYDKYGAYAITLINGYSPNAQINTNLTYRCGKNDYGRFQLTAATSCSREPLRVLRSLSVNSMCGSMAGVRYDGLYRVTGWAIHQPDEIISSSADQKVNLENIQYDVHLERCDPVPVAEVGKFPTVGQLDDCLEYERLRKAHGDFMNKGLATSSETNDMLPEIAAWPKSTSHRDLVGNPAATTASDTTMLSLDASKACSENGMQYR